MSTTFNVDKIPLVIEPNKCIVEDLEILSFESEEQLDYYSVWHETWFDLQRESKAESERERQIIRNEIVRKTSQYLIGSYEKKKGTEGQKSKKSSSAKTTIRATTTTRCSDEDEKIEENLPEQAAASLALTTQSTNSTPRPSPTKSSQSSKSKSARTRVSEASARRSVGGDAHKAVEVSDPPAEQLVTDRRPQAFAQPFIQEAYGGPLPKPGTAQLPNGLSILNSSIYNTLPSSKQLMKYKLTKLYNKYRGRQLRRNIVFERQQNLKIAQEESKCYLNSWLAYTALQALRLPDNNLNQLSTATNHSTKFLTTIAPPTALATLATPTTNTPTQSKKTAQSSSKKQKQLQQQQQQSSSGQMPPMHFVYIDPGSIITYSNKINPQQVADYRQNSHLLPSSATSKKSSAASYDVYEIMEVLANSNKNHVTITRNANRPAQPGCSVYSHSVNSHTPGIVSTQLHLQAKSYLDSMAKFYAEEMQRLREQPREPSIFDDLEDEGKILNQSETAEVDIESHESATWKLPTQGGTPCQHSNIDHPIDSSINSNNSPDQPDLAIIIDDLKCSDQDDVLEKIEEDIMATLTGRG